MGGNWLCFEFRRMFSGIACSSIRWLTPLFVPVTFPVFFAPDLYCEKVRILLEYTRISACFWFSKNPTYTLVSEDLHGASNSRCCHSALQRN